MTAYSGVMTFTDNVTTLIDFRNFDFAGSSMVLKISNSSSVTGEIESSISRVVQLKQGSRMFPDVTLTRASPKKTPGPVGNKGLLPNLTKRASQACRRFQAGNYLGQLERDKESR
ncbi:uncharacterized protein LOC122506135 isoform X2 [Leptopilina heterotoma]|uniref:uncharacterized protein LOC122506135 isoform X2 n=1 Tax=Leptopilina heterotoma TaxID=63436 RepID=UPI001CA9DB10|nr:uncharacterized protein LOC122506135 isoform X2 [Leptopilina heterotoma]